jgi:hypothetical protein
VASLADPLDVIPDDYQVILSREGTVYISRRPSHGQPGPMVLSQTFAVLHITGGGGSYLIFNKPYIGRPHAFTLYRPRTRAYYILYA